MFPWTNPKAFTSTETTKNFLNQSQQTLLFILLIIIQIRSRSWSLWVLKSTTQIQSETQVVKQCNHSIRNNMLVDILQVFKATYQTTFWWAVKTSMLIHIYCLRRNPMTWTHNIMTNKLKIQVKEEQESIFQTMCLIISTMKTKVTRVAHIRDWVRKIWLRLTSRSTPRVN